MAPLENDLVLNRSLQGGKLRNVWVWLHFKLAAGKWRAEPELFVELLRFKEMLLWITQVVQRLLGADQQAGIEFQAYQRLVAKRL